MCNSISCTSMRPRNLGNVINASMHMPYKKASRNMCVTVIPKKATSKCAIFVDTRQHSIII